MTIDLSTHTLDGACILASLAYTCNEELKAKYWDSELYSLPQKVEIEEKLDQNLVGLMNNIDIIIKSGIGTYNKA